MFYDGLHFLKGLPSPEGVWERVQLIGEGNYGEVYKARNALTADVAAVKVMEANLDKEEDIKAELNVFQNHSQHPNIVSFLGAFLYRDQQADDHLWIVMEYCSGGSVTDLVKNMRAKAENLPEDLISYILREVLEGLSYLHRAHVLHRDVKGQNVLLTSDARVRLIDFGISAVVENTMGRRRTGIGTPYWMAPEVIACEQQPEYDYDLRADVWSLGITAIEIADSTPPLFGEHPMRALFKIAKNKAPKVQNPNRWSKRFNGFIASCLVKDFEQRPTSFDMLAHEFVRFVPRDPRVLRRKLGALIDTYQPGESKDIFSESSSSVSGADTIKKELKLLATSKIVDDLASLEVMDESVLVSQLWKRYQRRLIYTNVGDILISINPFQKMDIYNEKIAKDYRGAYRGQLPPHIFAVAAVAYHDMLQENRDQCCVISGESGAGKTEASNILVQQFMRLGRAETKVLEEKILKVNPLLEAFGNARTIINNNSSRFGKYLELHFTAKGRIAGAHLSEYLLEKSRVVSQQRREKNFHIFYYLVAGLSARKLLARYRLKGVHHYLEQRGTAKGSAKSNAVFSERFEQIEKIFCLFGFSNEEFEQVCSILAAILNIGDIRIEGDFHSHIGEVSTISNKIKLGDVAHLLCLEQEHLAKAFTSTHVITHGETIVRPNTVEQAIDIRDAMAKALYGRLFSWIVNKINPELHSGRKGNVRSVGILDIFGFENFRVNSFEQLCINIANEQLQFYFNQHVFAWEQGEYEQEGIEVKHVGYEDNRPLLELLLTRPMGLLALLDEESKFPRANDLSLAVKFHGNFQTLRYYNKPKDGGPTFTILHYAGPVTYETLGFLEKNRDTLKLDVSQLLRTSENPIVQVLFQTPLSRTGGLSPASTVSKAPPSATPLFSRKAPPMYFASAERGYPHSRLARGPHSPRGRTPLSSGGTVTSKSSQTVSTYFINSLRDLMSKMLNGTPHFVRCIRPNELKSPDLFQPDKVLVQLRYTGVLETTRIRREGFSHRILFQDFIQRYKVIHFKMAQRVSATPASCLCILNKTGLKSWAVGKTKIFLKYYHVEKLGQLLAGYERAAVVAQRVVRGWLARKRVALLREEKRHRDAVKIQAAIRSFLAKCHYQKILDHRNHNATTIQRVVRSWLIRRRVHSWNKAAVLIQRVVRCWLAKRSLSRMKQEAKQRKDETVRAVLEREAILRAKQALQHSSTGSSGRVTTGISSRKQGNSPRSQPKKKIPAGAEPLPRLQRTSSPVMYRRQIRRQILRHGERVIWTPLAYYDEIQTQPGSNYQPQQPIAASVPRSPPLTNASKNVPDVGQKKQLYEELSRQQQSTTVGHGKPSLGHLNRKKHRAKPNSLIQKLLDRFDSPKHFT
jgi:myosin-3